MKHKKNMRILKLHHSRLCQDKLSNQKAIASKYDQR